MDYRAVFLAAAGVKASIIARKMTTAGRCPADVRVSGDFACRRQQQAGEPAIHMFCSALGDLHALLYCVCSVGRMGQLMDAVFRLGAVEAAASRMIGQELGCGVSSRPQCRPAEVAVGNLGAIMPGAVEIGTRTGRGMIPHTHTHKPRSACTGLAQPAHRGLSTPGSTADALVRARPHRATPY